MLRRFRAGMANNLLLKVTSFNAVSVVIQIIGGLITSKLIAIYLGERGMAFLGYLRNFLTATTATGSLGLTNGIIKYSASLKEEQRALSKILSTTVLLSLLATLIVSSILYFGADYWNTQVFEEAGEYTFIFKYLALALPLITLNGIFLSVVNGLSKYKKVVWIHIISNVIAVGITIIFIVTLNIEGALIALVIAPAIIFLVTLIMSGRKVIQVIDFKWAHVDVAAIRKLGSYSIMAVFSMIVLPLVYIAIRQEIVAVDGINRAGYWDAMSRISDYYLKFVATVMTLYILPQLAKALTDKEFRQEIKNFYSTILPLLGAGLIVIYVVRDFIIKTLFTDDFLPMESLFKWQLLGDFLKVASIVIGYQIIAKNMLKLFLITEIISLIVIYFSSVYFIQKYGFEGATIAHCVSYGVHLLLLLFIFRKPLFGKTAEI